MWRAAYILDKKFKGDLKSLRIRIPDYLKEDKNLILTFDVMKSGVKEYLENKSRSSDEKLKENACQLLQEIEAFSKEIKDFTS